MSQVQEKLKVAMWVNVPLTLATSTVRTAGRLIHFAHVAAVPVLVPGEVTRLIFVYHHR
jgi:hypothetical protein